MPGEGDRYVVTDGPAKGMKGYFVRGGDGSVEAVHMGGRIATRAGRDGGAGSRIADAGRTTDDHLVARKNYNGVI